MLFELVFSMIFDFLKKIFGKKQNAKVPLELELTSQSNLQKQNENSTQPSISSSISSEIQELSEKQEEKMEEILDKIPDEETGMQDEFDWDDDEFPEIKKLKRVMQAALFMSSANLTYEQLNALSGNNTKITRQAITELMDEFNSTHDVLEIVEEGSGYRMKVRPPYDDRVSHLASKSEFNKGVVKTLAFIAYKQPLLQSTLVKVRSNSAYDHLKILMDKGLISREPKGKSFVLRTTKKFVEYFGEDALKLKPYPKEIQENEN